MTKTLTPQQTEEQKQRFLNFLKTANLVKIGRKYNDFVTNHADEKNYNEYVYLMRVLKICANVDGNMYHPDYGNWAYRSSLLYHIQQALSKTRKK